MQPFLADSAPHRGRALVFAVVLAVATSIAAATLAMVPRAHHPRWHRHHHMLRIGQCTYVVR